MNQGKHWNKLSKEIIGDDQSPEIPFPETVTDQIRRDTNAEEAFREIDQYAAERIEQVENTKKKLEEKEGDRKMFESLPMGIQTSISDLENDIHALTEQQIEDYLKSGLVPLQDQQEVLFAKILYHVCDGDFKKARGVWAQCVAKILGASNSYVPPHNA
jgi:uncharacterized membrane protein YheB (UPF0754 family)